MKIWCTVLRKNGTYKTIPVKAGAEEFELDKKAYIMQGYRIGKIFGFITVLRALYVEGYPLPLEFNVEESMKKAKLKIDAKAIKNVTNKKILNVFGEAEFTQMEKILIMASFISAGLSVAVLILVLNITRAIGI